MAEGMDIVTPLGDGVLNNHRMTAREELSRLSVFEIDLLSDRGDIDANKILGQKGHRQTHIEGRQRPLL